MMASHNGNGNRAPRGSASAAQTVESAVRSARAAMLTNVQFAEMMRLRDAYDAARNAGDAVESARLEARILAIVREGPRNIA